MEENREKHSYQGNKKLMMETDTDKSFNPETDNVNKLGNPTPTLPPYDPAQSEDGLCDLTIKQPNTTVGSGQLSTTGRVAPDWPGPLNGALRSDRARDNPYCGKEPWDGAAVDNLGV